MPSYHQMGHDSFNLIFEPDLHDFNGAIISPVNCDQTKTIEFIQKAKEEHKNFELIFDPQLYYPSSSRGQLRNWSYFPSDVDTADISNTDWWRALTDNLLSTLNEINPHGVCSPAVHPRFFDPEYYQFINVCSSMLCERLSGSRLKIFQTALISLSNLTVNDYVMRLASILSRTEANAIYLIFLSTSNPRRELNDTDELIGAMLLIHLLESNGIEVLVGYTNSDLLLWKECGATSCASGKFFNLRRFTPSRWGDPEDGGGGGQLPYLFEENLLAYLRESDFTRIDRAGMFSNTTLNNPYFESIHRNISEGKPWLAQSWKFYLYWFSRAEKLASDSNYSSFDIIRNADRNWSEIDSRAIFFDERQNNGSWLRAWLRAITEYLT